MEIKLQLVSSIPSLYSFLPLLGSTFQQNPNNQPNTWNDILNMLATTKNEPQLINNSTNKKVGDWEFLTTIIETVINAATNSLDDHQNQNKNVHKTTATTAIIPSLGSNINLSDNNMEKDDKITTPSIEIRSIISSSNVNNK